MKRIAEGFCLFLGFAVLSGCSARDLGLGRHAHMDQKGMTCTEAQQVSIAAVQKLGYTVKDTKKPSPGQPGTVRGERDIGSGNIHKLLLQVVCTSDGAEVEADVEGGPIDNLSFAGDFQESFDKAATAPPKPRPVAEAGVDVQVVPERPNKNQLGIDFTGTGVLPVRVAITNHSPRAYRFKAVDVVLQQADGKRVQMLSKTEVAGKVPAATASALAGRWVADGDLKPGESVSGYLFYPFGGYVRARVTLQDINAGEEEGFAIEL